MTTPFDDPQAELAWMFLQCLSEGDVDECFGLLSEDFTYWNLLTRSAGARAIRRSRSTTAAPSGEPACCAVGP